MNEKIVTADISFYLRQLPLFALLSDAERRFVAGRAYAVGYKKGEVLYREGDKPDALYCVVTGRLAAFTKSQDSHEDILEYIHRGVYFGIISLLTGEGHSVSVKAVNDSVILKIDKPDFAIILKNIPKLAIDVSQMLSRRLKQKEFHKKSIFESTIISVYSTVRTAGRTVYAINLALGLAKETKRRVVMLDMSPSGRAAARALRLEEKFGTIDLHEAGFDYRRVKETLQGHPDGIDLLGISHDLKKKSDITHIAPLLTCLASDYHYIILDLPYGLDRTVFKALTQSDVIHVIASPERRALESTRALIEKLEKEIPESAPKTRVIMKEPKDGPALAREEIHGILQRKIYAAIPYVPEDKFGKEGARIAVAQPESEYARMIRRIARDAGGLLVGLALGGGAAFGLIHIGVLKVIEREKIPVDIIAGTSMGAMIGAIWALGKTAEEMEKIALKFKDKHLLLRLIDPVFPRSGLIGGRGIMKMLQGYLGDKTFQDVKVPLKVVSCDINSREAVVIDEGRLQDAVAASIAIPGVFKPVRQKDRVLIDGGVVEPVPVGTLARMGAKKIIAVNPLVSAEEEKERLKKAKRKFFMPTIFDVMVNTVLGMEYEIAQSACRQADIVIHPGMGHVNWYEFNKADEIIKIGEDEAAKQVADIKRLLAE